MRIACYVRVSTLDQNLNRQIESTADYAQGHLGAELGEIKTYRDRSSGTNTERSGYRQMMADVETGDISAVVVHSVSRIARSIRDLDRSVERIVNNSSTELHIISEGFELVPDDTDPYQTAMLRLLGVFAELEADLAQQRTREGIASRQNEEDYHHGPAPLGFSKDNGELHEDDNYHEVAAVLEMVQTGNLSKRKAAVQLGCSRSTISRALDRGEMYGI